MLKLRIALFAFSFLFVLQTAAKSERLEVKPRIIRLKLKSLIHGQPEAGLKEVEIKLNHFLKDFDLTLAEFLKLRHRDQADEKVQEVLSSVTFERFLSTRNIQVVRDPRGKFQIFDGHHLAQSLRLLEVDDVDVELHEDFWLPENARSRQTFAARMEKYRTYMIEHRLVRLVDIRGRKIDLEDLPSGSEALKNNPFRSLSWILKKAGVYEDLEIPFQEFTWAEFLQKEFKKRGLKEGFHSNREFITAVNSALTILSKNENVSTDKLPGYVELPKKLKKLRDKKEEIIDRCERLLY